MHVSSDADFRQGSRRPEVAGNQARHHDEAIEGLQAQYQALQRRIDTMYIDKLEGRVDNEFFDAKAAEWREDQRGILRDLRRHQEANTDYLDAAGWTPGSILWLPGPAQLDQPSTAVHRDHLTGH